MTNSISSSKRSELMEWPGCVERRARFAQQPLQRYGVGNVDPFGAQPSLGRRGRLRGNPFFATPRLRSPTTTLRMPSNDAAGRTALLSAMSPLHQKSLTNEQAGGMIASRVLWTLRAVEKRALGIKHYGDLPPFFGFAAGTKDGQVPRIGASVMRSRREWRTRQACWRAKRRPQRDA